MTWRDVVRINAYVTGREHLRPYMDVRNRRFAAPYPASTLMIVSGFARPEFVVEIEVDRRAPETARHDAARSGGTSSPRPSSSRSIR